MNNPFNDQRQNHSHAPGHREHSPKLQSLSGFPLLSESSMLRHYNLETKFNESFVMVNQLQKQGAAYKVKNSHNQAKFRNQRVGPMMSRKFIQKTHEMHCLESLAKRTSGLRMAEKPKASQQKHSQPSREDHNGSRVKSLNLLEDQREEIQRIITKKKKDNMAGNCFTEASPTMRTGSQELRGVKPRSPRLNLQDATLSTPAGASDPKKRVSLSKPETMSPQSKQKGGGFFSPARKFLQAYEHAESPAKGKRTATNVKALQTLNSVGSQEPTGRLPKIATKRLCPREEVLNSKTLFPESAATPGPPVSKKSVKKKPLVEFETQAKPPSARQQHSLFTPPNMKANLSNIIDNSTSLEQQVRQNGQIRKDRMYQFQNDFVLKMDQMNKELANEVQGHYHTIDSGEGRTGTGARAASRRSRVTLGDGDVRKI